MGTSHLVAAEQVASRAMANGDGAALADIMDGLRTKRYSPGYVAAFCGSGWTGRTPGQLYSFARIHSAVVSGELGLVRVEVGTGPGRDKGGRQSNAALLADLPGPFVADLDLEQNCADSDGAFGWTEPITVTAGPAGGERQVEVAAHDLEHGAPLEVGSCAPSRIYLHLFESGAVARWPYGQSDLWILVGLPSPFGFAASQAQSISAIFEDE